MNVSRALIVFLAVLMSAPLAAQNAGVDVGVWGSWANMGGPTRFEDDDSLVEFDDASGFGISANFFWGRRISTELAVYSISTDGTLAGGPPIPFTADLGSLNLTPITATLQLHFAPHATFAPYVGAGIAHVIAGRLESTDLDLLGIGTVEVDDETTWHANAGINFRITPNFGIGVDAKYISLRAASRAAGEVADVELELNPLIISLGARFRF
jgi:outer membrane protein W